MAYNFDNMTCREFTEVLSSRASVPGGGGAAAMVGAIAVSLGNMVGNLTTGKPQYAAVEPEIQAALEQGEQLRQHLLDLVEADAAAFAPMSAVFKMPKSTDEEKAARNNYSCIHNSVTKSCCGGKGAHIAIAALFDFIKVLVILLKTKLVNNTR